MLPRKFMASPSLSQDPVVCLPHERLRKFLAENSGGPAVSTRLQYSSTQQDNLERTAQYGASGRSTSTHAAMSVVEDKEESSSEPPNARQASVEIRREFCTV